MSSRLPEGLTRRPLTRANAAAAAALFDDDEVFRGARPRLEAGDALDWWLRADLAHDSWLFEDDGRPVAVGWVQEHDAIGLSSGCVHPAAKGRGIGSHLVGLAENCARDKSCRRLRQLAPGADDAARALFESRGYRDRRHYFEMAIDLDEQTVEPELPTGYAIESFRTADAQAYHAAATDAFAEDEGVNLPPVDTGNPTGALGLYERAGMHVAAEYVSFERELDR